MRHDVLCRRVMMILRDLEPNNPDIHWKAKRGNLVQHETVTRNVKPAAWHGTFTIFFQVAVA